MRPVLAFLAAGLLSTPALAAEKPVAIGYVPAFKGIDAIVERGGFQHYSHLVLAFVNVGPSGEILAEDGLACAPSGESEMITDKSLRRFVEAARKAHAKVIASLGGGTIPKCSGDWAVLLRPETRSKVVAGLMELVDRYQLDGIDVDLEGELMTRIDREGNYTPFIQQLSAALRSRSKLLTSATGSYEGGMVPDASLPYFDLIGIMSYDAIGPTWGTPGDEHASYEQAEKDLRLWLAKGVPASRLALGLPFYGRGFGSYRQSWSIAEIAEEKGEKALESDVLGKRCGGCDYVTFNGLPTLERKAMLAGAWGAGVMVWEIDEDLPDDRAIRRVLAGHAKGRAINAGR
jgi:GH18 family chitinase